MSKLRDLQKNFVDTITALTPPDQTNPLCDLVEENGLTHAQRFSIYRDNSLMSLCDIIVNTYQTCASFFPSEEFTSFAYTYCRTHLPTNGVLDNYGHSFPQYLEKNITPEKFPWIPDLALFERALNTAFYAPEYTSLNPTILSQLPEDQYPNIRFHLAPPVTLIKSWFDLGNLHQQHKSNAVALPDAPSLLSSPKQWIIYRETMVVTFQELSSGEYAFLQGCSAKNTFEKSYEYALQEQKDFDLSKSLQRFFGMNLFQDLELLPSLAP